MMVNMIVKGEGLGESGHDEVRFVSHSLSLPSSSFQSLPTASLDDPEISAAPNPSLTCLFV